MRDLIDRAHVLLRTAVTYLVALAVGVSAAADELAALAPDGSETSVAWLLRVATWIGSAVAIVRRVSPAERQSWGLLGGGHPIR